MSGHSVVWDADLERLTLVCEEPADALCHWEPDCQCEQYWGIERDADGVWSHLQHDDLVIFGAEPVRHKHTRETKCHYFEWWDDADVGSECGPREAHWTYGDNDQPIPPPVGAIEFEWDGDTYIWNYVEEQA